ncbi:NAD(P)/FAD-dependent oxidoreductase [Nonomuraea angiospora]|uniref:3-(3-hydroxy-phenyl)propionate hydroxylase n=1 Tax=Nonomuraea angiospora TaxID=46172 RepID=A0ABR9LNC2_9ACTN|nr:NAD(P)/FAD-dependent oxidoreductase [Nonomuraea angiospora]MBE1582154.1 3-(3-hydroxy-phenyl)propionate hydroxylase [Nonomuraea angiospora]
MIDGPLIVGAGPVGLSAALLARARGLPAHVLERLPETEPKPGSRAIFLHRQTIQTLASASPVLADHVLREGLVWRGRRTYWAGRRVHHRRYEPVRPRLAPFVSLPQPRAERLLREAAVRAGVTFSWGAQADDVTLLDTSVLVRAADGRQWRSAFVVAADGAGSVVRRRLGILMDGDAGGNAFVVVDVADDPDRPLPAERVFHYRHPRAAGRNVLIIPFTGGHRVDLQCRARDDPAELAADPRAWLRPLLPSGHACEVTWSSHYLFRQAVAQTFTMGRVLLAGEAAHLYAPFGARGLNSGIADAAAAIDAIVNAGPGPDAVLGALAGYDRVRRAAAERNRAAAGKALAHLTAAGPHRQAAQRAAALAARVLPRAGTWLDSKPYGPRDAGIPGSLY